MIVGAVPRLRQIVREVWRPLTILFVWDVAVTVFHFAYIPIKEPPLPLALFGTALALFLGFRTNAAYARWWEARTLWGAIVNASRSLARLSVSLSRAGGADVEWLRDKVVIRQIAFAHALRCQLRGQPTQDETVRVLGAEAEGLTGRRNPANALLEEISACFADALKVRQIAPVQQTFAERTLTDIANAQGGLERIRNTPMPMGFRFLPMLFARIFCVLLPITMVEQLGLATPVGSTLIGLVFLAALSIGEDLTDPFSNSVHDVPLSAITRTIEIDLLQAIGREAPEALGPDEHGVLW
ncbi:MAG: bestrophin family ion channel [Pseudomonadota bacterium]